MRILIFGFSVFSALSSQSLVAEVRIIVYEKLNEIIDVIDKAKSLLVENRITHTIEDKSIS